MPFVKAFRLLQENTNRNRNLCVRISYAWHAVLERYCHMHQEIKKLMASSWYQD
jgi:hypothetical protein